MSRVARNPVLLCVHHTMMMSLFPMAIITLFQRDHLGLSVTEIMLLQAIFGVALAVFEFPSGYLADRIGYRPSMILASGLSVLGWSAYAFAIGFWSIAFAEILLGLSLSLISGTNSAMLYESLAEEGLEDRFAQWYGRTRFFGQAGEGTAALLAGVLFAWSVRLPFFVQVAFWVINIGVALALVEPRVHRPIVEQPWRHIRGLVRYVVRERPRLRAVFASATIVSLATFAPVWLIQLYASDAGVPVSWLGPIWAVANYTVAVASLVSHRVRVAIGVQGSLWICIAAIAVGYFGLGFSHALLGFAFYFAFGISRGISAPVYAEAEQAEIPSSDRATLISMRSLVFRLSFGVLGPAMGVAVDAVGQHPVLLWSGAGFVGFGALSLFWLARSPATGRPSEAPEAPANL